MPAETHVERSPIGPDDVFRIIRERLAEILEIDEDRITMDSDFAADLDAVLGAVGAVGQRAVEEVVVDERPAQRELESCIECRVDGTAPPSGHHKGRLRSGVRAVAMRLRCVSI